MFLESVDLVLAQSDEHARRFVSLGVDPARVVVTGNLKYYREIRDIPDTPNSRNAVTFGSVKEKELPIVMAVIGRLKPQFPDYRFFVAPRELKLVDEIEEQLPAGLAARRYSETQAGPCRWDGG